VKIVKIMKISIFGEIKPTGPQQKGVTSSSQTPPLVEEEAPFARKSLEKKNMVMGPDGTRNQELFCWRGPQQFNRLADYS
jgi:hypothetical protein